MILNLNLRHFDDVNQQMFRKQLISRRSFVRCLSLSVVIKTPELGIRR